MNNFSDFILVVWTPILLDFRVLPIVICVGHIRRPNNLPDLMQCGAYMGQWIQHPFGTRYYLNYANSLSIEPMVSTFSGVLRHSWKLIINCLRHNVGISPQYECLSYPMITIIRQKTIMRLKGEWRIRDGSLQIKLYASRFVSLT